jgi:sn-glycerol 3-phosphate transport system substrate-binding protein
MPASDSPLGNADMSDDTRRSVLRGAATLLGAGSMTALAGCAGGGDGSGGDSQFSPIAEELTVWHAMGGENGETLNQIASDFEDETGTAVNMEFQDSYENVLTNTLAAFDSGNVSDMLQVDSLFAQQVLDTGQIRSVEEILPDDFDADGFLDNVADFFTIDGELSSMPFNNSNAIMYINRDAFEEAGLDPDDPPTTIEEVRAASEALVNQDVTEFGITWPNHVWFVEHFYSFEGETMLNNENGHSGTPTEFRTPDAVYDLYEWWKGMSDDELYTNPGIEAWGEATSLFVEERVGMLMTSTGSAGGLIADTEGVFDVDASPHPSISDTRVGPVIGGASFYVPDGLPEERYEDIGQLLAFMADPAVQVDWHKQTGYYPITESSIEELESENWFEENPMYATALEQLQAAETDNPATSRILVGPARAVQTTVQNKSVEIINSDDIASGIEAMKQQAEEELDSYYN